MATLEVVRTATTSEEETAASAIGARAPRRGLAQLFPREEGSAFVTWPLRGTQTLGRQSDCGIQVADPRLSRRHARVTVEHAGLSITDLDSRHGTFLQGERLVSGRHYPVGDNSVLRCGDTLLCFTDNVEAYAMAPQRLAKAYVGLRHDFIAGPKLFQKWQQATRAASAAHPVLITGESGSGKEAIARLVHAGRAAPGPFVALNVAALPEGLFESELFGHTRGAFTGASSPRVGAFREATGGVLFLDEIGDLRLDLQVKLLRALESGVVRPLGAATDLPIDVRVVAATSRDLGEAMSTGRFRADLYYRLAGVVIALPPLRERPEDVVTLTLDHLKGQTRELSITVDALEKLLLLRWEGNVRELQHTLHQAVAQADACGAGQLLPSFLPDLPLLIGRSGTKQLTQETLLTAMTKCQGNASRAAKLLGVSRATLYNFCSRQGLELAGLRIGGHVRSP